MAYKFIFRFTAQNEFESLTQGQKKAIFEKLKTIEVDPMGQGKTLVGYESLRRVKAGNVRAIYDPEPDAKGHISILRIGTNHSVYELEELAKKYLAKR